MFPVKIKGELFFFIAFAIHLLAILFSWNAIVAITKPLLLISLVIFYLGQSREQKIKHSLIVLSALVFSLLGDLLLQLQGKEELFFILGLGAFLIAHIFYILWFWKQIKQRSPKINWVYVALVIIYTAALLFLLWPKLGSLKIPVVFYGIVIGTMLITAIGATSPIKNFITPALFLLYGAKFFVISDSLLAINKFYLPFAGADFLIMLTYGLAQYFLVKGILDRQEIVKKTS